ncbi:hypothetical protein C8R43DRAFT_493464 [Mycena crocata]|nr:hypothetical protein C8R43DRAFT_493464 [Mycena crocata]
MDESPVSDTQDPFPSTVSEDEEPRLEDLPALSPVDQQRMSEYILTQRDRPIPSLQTMREFLDLPDDIAKARTEDEVNENYERDLERLYMAQAEEYIDDAEDRYYSCDETQLADESIEAQAYSRFRWKGCNPQFEWDYAVARTKSVYNGRVKKSDFPNSIDEYRLKPKETQLRVARFLLLESDEQKEKMCTEFGWGWRQVTSLTEEFQGNPEFQDEIRSVIAELNVVDPRKR